MTKKFCDRCGQEVAPEYSWQQTVFPVYIIQKMDNNIHNGLIHIDLCPSCNKEFINWITVNQEDNNDI